MIAKGIENKKLKSAWQDILGKAVRLGSRGGKVVSFEDRKDSFIKKGGLMMETTETPWDIQVQTKGAGTWRRLKRQNGSLASAMMRGAINGGAVLDPYLKGMTADLAALGLPQGCGAMGDRAWKKRSRKGAQSLVDQSTAAIQAEGLRGTESGMVYATTVKATSYGTLAGADRGIASTWKRLCPEPGLRRELRRLKLGSMEGVKLKECRRTKGWSRVQSQFKDRLICDCERPEVQTGAHMWFKCTKTEGLRARVVAAADASALELGLMDGGVGWGTLTSEQKLFLLLKNDETCKTDEAGLRADALREWVGGLKGLEVQLREENSSLVEEVKAAVGRRRLAASMDESWEIFIDQDDDGDLQGI